MDCLSILYSFHHYQPTRIRRLRLSRSDFISKCPKQTFSIICYLQLVSMYMNVHIVICLIFAGAFHWRTF